MSYCCCHMLIVESCNLFESPPWAPALWALGPGLALVVVTPIGSIPIRYPISDLPSDAGCDDKAFLPRDPRVAAPRATAK